MEPGRFFVSVIIPVYNGEAFLADALASIRQQNYRPLEIIVVDDGSTDNTATLARSFGDSVRYVSQPNSGPPAARNRGLRTARGNVIGFLDADDLWCDNKLELQLSRFVGQPKAEIVVGYTQRMQLTCTEDGKHTFRKWADRTLSMSLGCALFRKSVFDKVGFFDETLRHCDDWDWFMRAKELGISMIVHEEVTRFYRRHGNNITNQIELGNHYMLRMLKQSLNRRRTKEDGPVTELPKLSDFKE
jgi:glycosyltransferase involved in cell wall biosynthesis